jgi:dihydroorotase
MTHKEDFMTGSMAAAAGGITTFLDMPNTIPPTSTIALLDEKRRLAEKSIVNYGFHFCAASVDSNSNVDEIKKAKNIASVKVFMNLSTGKLMINDEKVLDEIFAASKENPGIVSVHAEEEMVEKAIKLAKKHNTKLYLCHISKADEVNMIRREKTHDVFVEVTPHHLFLTEIDDKDSFTKMKPSLRTLDDQEALWQAIDEGIVDTIGTDHAPHTVEEKQSAQFPYGIPGCETMLPLLLNSVNESKISLETIQKLCCENPANIFRIKNKGFIREGYDADLVVVDMDLVKTVDNAQLFTKCKWSPFRGKTLTGWPVMTIVNGAKVFDYYSDRQIINIEVDEKSSKEVEFNVR